MKNVKLFAWGKIMQNVLIKFFSLLLILPSVTFVFEVDDISGSIVLKPSPEAIFLVFFF